MSHVLYEQQGPVARLTLNRPEKLNALNDALWNDLFAALDQVARDDAIRVAVIAGAGRAFCVGQDLSGEGTAEVTPPDPGTRPYLADLFQGEQRRRQRWEALYNHPKLLVAQVHGYCLAAGCDLAMLCYALVCAEDAIFGDPSIRAGYVTSNPLWTWKVGVRAARDLLFTGRYIDGREAERIGLATVAVPRAGLAAKVDEVVDQLLRLQGIAGREGVAFGFMEQHGGRPLQRTAMDGAGLATAWGFTTNVAALSQVQRRGFRPDEPHFWALKSERGLRAALAERDGPARALFPWPPAPEE